LTEKTRIHSFGTSKLYFSSDDDTIMTEESLAHIFLPTLDNPEQYAFDLSFESESDFETSPRNVTSQALTNNSFLYLPDDILYDGLVEISSRRTSPRIKLLPRFSSQVHSIFAGISSEDNILGGYLDIAFADSFSDDEDSKLEDISKHDIDIDSIQQKKLTRTTEDHHNEDYYWKSISENYGARLMPENNKSQWKIHSKSKNVVEDCADIDAMSTQSPTVRYSYWEEAQEFLESSCFSFSCNKS
jgi:hypothetical protein